MKVRFPHTNPVTFRKIGTYESSQDSLLFEEGNEFLQPFYKTDRIQFIVNWSDLYIVSHTIKLEVLKNGVRTTISEHNLTTAQTGGSYYTSYFKQEFMAKNILAGYYVFSNIIQEIKVNNTRVINDCDEFQFVLTLLGTEYFSNKMILIDSKEETKLIQYGVVSDSRYGFASDSIAESRSATKPTQIIYLDTLYSALFEQFEVRVPGYFLTPKNEALNEIFESYSRNVELINSVPFQNITLQIGFPLGVSDSFVRTLNYVFNSKGKKIDGVKYELSPDSSFSVETIPLYNRRYLNVDVCESINNFSYINEIVDVLPTLNRIVLQRKGRERVMFGSFSVKGTGSWQITDEKDGTLLKIKFSQLKGTDSAFIEIDAPLNLTEEEIENTLVFSNGNEEYEFVVITPPNTAGIGYWRIEQNFVVS